LTLERPSNDAGFRLLAYCLLSPGFAFVLIFVLFASCGPSPKVVIPVLFKANETKIENDLEAIIYAAKENYSHTGNLAKSIADLVNPTDESGAELPGLEEMPKDPWGNEYGYELIKNQPHAFCLGRDQKPGGEGDDQDHFFPPRE